MRGMEYNLNIVPCAKFGARGVAKGGMRRMGLHKIN